MISRRYEDAESKVRFGIGAGGISAHTTDAAWSKTFSQDQNQRCFVCLLREMTLVTGSNWVP